MQLVLLRKIQLCICLGKENTKITWVNQMGLGEPYNKHHKKFLLIDMLVETKNKRIYKLMGINTRTNLQNTNIYTS